jgi:hypothetical protein
MGLFTLRTGGEAAQNQGTPRDHKEKQTCRRQQEKQPENYTHHPSIHYVTSKNGELNDLTAQYRRFLAHDQAYHAEVLHVAELTNREICRAMQTLFAGKIPQRLFDKVSAYLRATTCGSITSISRISPSSTKQWFTVKSQGWASNSFSPPI